MSLMKFKISGSSLNSSKTEYSTNVMRSKSKNNIGGLYLFPAVILRAYL